MCRHAWALLAALLSLPGIQVAHAGEIFGRVTDSAGAALPGVLVTVVAPSLAAPRQAFTGASGSYRLARIPAGTYLVSFSRDGFERAEQPDLVVTAGFHVRLDARLGLTSDPVRRSTSSPALLDPRTSSVQDAAGRESVAVLPIERRDVAILEFLPGTTAGWQSRQDPVKVMRGSAHTFPMIGHERTQWWTVDGRPLLAGHDGPAIALDLGSVQEIRVERGAVDVSVQSGAAQIVTRSGTNRFAGSVHLGITGRLLQWDNLTPALREQGATLGRRVQRSGEGALEAGGPVQPRKAWAWVSASKSITDVGIIGFYKPACLQPDGLPDAGARDRLECLVADHASVVSGSAKLQYQASRSSRTTVLWGRTSRTKPFRGASAFDRLEATTRQHSLGMARPLALGQQWAPSDRLAVDAGYTFSDSSFALDFQEPGLADVQPAYDRYTLVNWRSGSASRQLRRSHAATISLDGFLPRGAGSHTVTFGTSFLTIAEEQFDRTGGGAVAVFDSRTGPQLPWQARIVRDGHTSRRSPQWSAFAQESYARGRLTANLGVRLDRQDDEALPAAIPANRLLPDLLPAVRFPGADSGVVYNDVSPRVGVTWDAGTRGATLIKIGAARYHATGNATSARLQPTGQTRLVYWWNDTDGDRLVEEAELDFRRGMAATPTANYDAANPASPRTPATVDRRLRNVRNDEFSLGAERQVGRRATLRASYVARRIYRLQASYAIEADGSAVSSTTFRPVQWTPSNCPAGARCPAVVYYERDTPLPARTVLRNDGRYEWRHRADFSLRKRLADGWTLDAALTWNRSVAHFPRATWDYTDPTNIALREGTEYPAPDPRWVAKLSGSVRLPAGFSSAFLLAGQEGLPYDRVVTTPSRGALGGARVSIERFGTHRYPQAWRLDARLDWRCQIGRVTLVPTLNVFNALNSNVVLARNRVQNSRSANQVTDILAPRMMRIDATLRW